MAAQFEAFRLYRSPESQAIALPSQPRLASWDRADHPSQLHLARFLDDFEATVSVVAGVTAPLTVQLNVALEPGTPLLLHRDLDNYLTPLMTRLRARDVASVWGTKTHGVSSTLQIETATLASDDLRDWCFAHGRPTGSATSTGWKQSLRDQIAGQATEAPPGALEMQVSFRVGPERAWANLWKQTLDALGPVLGFDEPRNPFHPLDGRIVRLGLHHTPDAAMGFDVEVGVWWRTANGVVEEGARPPVARTVPTVKVAAPRSEVSRPAQAEDADGQLVEFRNDDQGYVAWIEAHPDGFVVNTTRSHSRSYLKLHRATCRHVRVLQGGYSTWTSGEYVKACSPVRARLEQWAREVAGGELQAGCPCRP